MKNRLARTTIGTAVAAMAALCVLATPAAAGELPGGAVRASVSSVEAPVTRTDLVEQPDFDIVSGDNDIDNTSWGNCRPAPGRDCKKRV
ncbi:hypothetical protein OOK31_18775 [Streptomyces sp. NBC_00249]|uniref:hypothetical protein n=1 Tax=Streptomyces sp. NBC_00249 TaxID=2975690 RepID=UPI0022512A08|nr:hypothetical protein [Streptomyces sp. NBC_00249]MCX5195911.1 hypothetical protein [Streptomyces sp. NBC_00249]